jgi:C-8 sterol isomerase
VDKTEDEHDRNDIGQVLHLRCGENAGGATGFMYILYASITEYLIIFGTSPGTEGHSGRHSANDCFHILEREQWASSANTLVLERYPKGSVHYLPRGQIKQYKMHKRLLRIGASARYV